MCCLLKTGNCPEMSYIFWLYFSKDLECQKSSQGCFSYKSIPQLMPGFEMLVTYPAISRLGYIIPSPHVTPDIWEI